MWIICAGGKRSGSTLQYNLVANIVETANSGKRLPYFNPSEFHKIKKDNSEYSGLKVIKLHKLTSEIEAEIKSGNALVIHSYRDIRDVIVSSINKKWFNEDSSNVKEATLQYLDDHNQWTQCNGKIISRKYEDFAFNISEEIQVLCDFLDIRLDQKEIESIADSVNLDRLKNSQAKIPNNKKESASNQTFNKDTLLHTNHIHDGSRNQFLNSLSPFNIALIESISFNFLKKYDYKFYWVETPHFISSSQHADDYIAWQLLGKRSKGVVVEVGAFDGVHLSNSYSLEQLGWKAICIEPNPRIFKYLEKQRPNAININKAVVGNPETQEVTFYDEEIGVLSGVSYDEEDVKRRYENRGLYYKEPNKVTVASNTLGAILDSLKQKHVDVLSIDVEGFEVEVLKGLDITKVSVDLFIIEANTLHEKKAIMDHFQQWNDYIFIGNNLQNLFFIRKKAAKKKNFKKLDFKNYLPAKQKHPVSDALCIDSIPPKFEKSQAFSKVETSFSLF
ncbi:FkbM family methyltransferase [Flavobacteriaceae bacterium TK19130]|nr:FkbM family methyltransferase [Thermobacterium salinum]